MSICFVCGIHDTCADCVRLTRPAGVVEPTLFDDETSERSESGEDQEHQA